MIFSLSAALCSAASFYNGQAARAVIGQNAFTDGYMPATAVSNILGGTGGLAFKNGLLYVVDDNRLGATPQNDRIMIFDTRQIAGPSDDLTNVTTPSPRCHLCGYGALGVLGQVDFSTTAIGRSAVPAAGAGSLNHPVGVATDGQYFAVADTDNNRVLLWNSVPSSPSVAPNVVLGQTDFTSFQSPQPINANSLRGPQGVWISNGKLFVADTGNYRVLVWNSIPTRNNQPADFALGQPNLSSAQHPPDSQQNPPTTASALSNPTGVSSDGTRLYVADLGYNRVLIWNTIPTTNGQPADVVIGQAAMTTSNANNNTAVCSSPNNDASGNPQYPFRCQATLSFPRFVLPSNGKLFIADSGNDRVLVFNSIPTSNGAKADIVLGQPDFINNQITNVQQSIASTTIDNSASVDTVQGPNSLAYDGLNLYVSDPYNRRVVVYTPADTPLPNFSVLNWASEIIRQEGAVILTGTAVANDTVTVTIAGTAYTYTIKANDTLGVIAQGLVAAINANAGDPNATALFGGTGSNLIYLSSKGFNLGFDAITLSASTLNAANLVATASNGYLTAGTAATGAPGTLVEINAPDGQTLADSSATAASGQLSSTLPTSLAGAQVFIDGLAAPLLRVSPSQIVAQLPYAVQDRSSISLYVRTQHNGGNVTVTNANPVYIAPANPGLFNAPSYAGQIRPWPALGALHQITNPSSTVSIDGSIQVNDTATLNVNGRTYSHLVVAGDTLFGVRDDLINKVNNGPDPDVTASPGAAFTRIILTARQPGSAGNGIPVSATSTTTATGGTVSIALTAYTPATCCNVPRGQPLTPLSPAQAGETIVLLGTGLGNINAADANQTLIPIVENTPYLGPQPNGATQFVSATMSGVTAQIVGAGLPQYSLGVYYVQMIVPTTLSPNPTTPVYIAQNAYISNTVSIPVGSAGPFGPASPSSLFSALPPSIAPVSQIVVSPANLVFTVQSYANLNIGSQTVSIRNPAGGNLAITGLTITGVNASDFQVSTDCPASLGANLNCTATVSFSPAGSGTRTANLVVSSGAANSPQTIPLTGTPSGGFEIVSQLTGKALQITGAASDPFVPVTQAEINNQPYQRWILTPLGGDQYAIYNTITGKVMDVAGASKDLAARVWQYAYIGADNQKWFLRPVENGYFAVINVNSGLALDLASFDFSEGAFVQQYAYMGGANQKWKFTNFQTFQIQSALTGSNIDIRGPSLDSGTLIHEWTAAGYQSQQWLFVPVDNTYFKIVNTYSQKALDVQGFSTDNFGLIHQWVYNGTDNQLWTLVPEPNGTYAIVNKLSGKALDIAGNSAVPGTTIWQYSLTGALNQQWKLVPSGLFGI